MRIGATPEPNDSKLTNNQQPIDNSNENSVWAKFNDDNNKVDISDVNYVMNNNFNNDVRNAKHCPLDTCWQANANHVLELLGVNFHFL